MLLVYTVPASPTRKRALVWRELKKMGAVYLRDGVAVLPDRPDTTDGFHALALKIEDMAGSATIISGATIDVDRAASLVSEARAARDAEYAAIVDEATALLTHLRREPQHREFGPGELEALDADIGKLRRWIEQVRSRDYFGRTQGQPAQALAQQCADSLAALLERPAHAGIAR